MQGNLCQSIGGIPEPDHSLTYGYMSGMHDYLCQCIALMVLTTIKYADEGLEEEEQKKSLHCQA